MKLSKIQNAGLEEIDFVAIALNTASDRTALFLRLRVIGR